MKRLSDQNINTPEMADEIFRTRWDSKEHTVDWNRFAALAKHFKGGRYLDLGCFNSPMPGHLSEQFPDADIFAIDHAPEVIKKMQEMYPKVHYICADFLSYKWLPEDMGYFDYIVAGEVIEHLEDPQQFIDGVYKLLKPGGIFALSTPFEERISQPAVSHEHIWAFTLEDIKQLLSKFRDFNVEINQDTVKLFLAYGTKK